MSAIAEIIPLKKDAPYSARAIRETIEKLYATGRYSDIQVDAAASGEGVALRFITRSSWFIGHVEIDSDLSEPPSPGQILSATRLDLGEPFEEQQIGAAADAIRSLLDNYGYFGAEVSSSIKRDGTYQQVYITFTVRAEKRARYEAPLIKGDTSVLSAQAIDKAVTGWQPDF